MRAWVLTDGKAGDEQPCLGVAEAVADRIERRRAHPRAPWVWLAPWGPLDPREAPDQFGSPIAPKASEGWPDVVVAAGRRVVPHLRRLKREAGDRVLTVFLRDARAGCGIADLVWVPEHDRLRGPNVIATPTSPHRINAVRLAAARAAPPLVPATTAPRVAVLLGGDTRHHRFGEDDVDRLVAGLVRLKADGAALMATASRRTPSRLAMAVKALAHYFWDGTGDNPYISLLAQADALVVTADSTNMVGEAVATGAPVMVFEPSGGRPKTRAFLDRLTALGAIRPFAGKLERYSYAPIDSTPEIARAIQALAATRTFLRREAREPSPAAQRETNGRPR